MPEAPGESRSAADIHDWDRIAGRYRELAGTPDDRIYQQFKAVLWEALGDISGLDILDLGCGHGWLSKQLHDAGAHVWGVDGSQELLTHAHTACPAGTFWRHDLARGLPPLGRTFDRIVAYMVLMDIPELDELITAVRTVLKPDGRFLFTLPHPCFFNQKSRRDEATGRMFRMVTGYLEPEIWRIENFGGHNHYHRSLTFYVELLRKNRLVVARLYEPPHIPDPSVTNVAFFTTIPVFILLEARPLPGG